MFQKDAMTFEWRRCFFAEGYFQKYLQALCRHIEKCSVEIAEEGSGRCKNTER